MVAQRIGEQIGTPTTFLFKKGKMVRKFFGFLPELSFQDFLNGTLDKTPAPAQKFDQNKPLDLTKQSLTELKAIAYDARELKEKIERDIQIINQEIQSRVK
jgi:thioredoxin-like negative regulator of GroEL